ncbi:GspE/PulE family protein [Tepidibacillus fermentans]|uniref:Type IV pilus assembly protein PilB n=1 Tax=Tepidibacillus fermentans TaxID=1281767 RepID=A0A4R3KJQ4_9BACI|nr:GspE/PulE family protein [Tepidibacillus fermentans]TCS83983.1 type IV pilus assembly protein PilB [Tepidibacillus fermentans]
MEIPEYIDRLIDFCLSFDASDIHIEPFEKKALIRYRVDGFLKIYEEINLQHQKAILTRIKVLADLNVAEKRLPQDGAITIDQDGLVTDLRISILPTIYGEKMVIRLLKKEPRFKKIEELGMSEIVQIQYQRVLKQTNGLILITGPTSSGKTTTLYASLHFLNQVSHNITTLEDPVEYKIEGINQVQVQTEIGLTFARGLRSILRQDPNVIMIGEIRDKETANIAIEAALTGHLVLSSLHTYDSASAITRLLDMGIEPYLVASAIQMILAQRLVRKRCNCQGADPNCISCSGEGYIGRFAIFEGLPIVDSIRELILQQASTQEIRSKMRELHYKQLQDILMEKVEQGETTIEEFHRVLVTDYE